MKPQLKTKIREILRDYNGLSSKEWDIKYDKGEIEDKLLNFFQQTVESVIGEDEYHQQHVPKEQRNKLRKEQRQRLQAILEGK